MKNIAAKIGVYLHKTESKVHLAYFGLVAVEGAGKFYAAAAAVLLVGGLIALLVGEEA